MGIASFPAASAGLSSVVKSIQRGSASTAGNISITAVTTSKTQVLSFSTSSAGTVAATGAINAASGTASSQSGTSSATSTSGSGTILAAGTTVSGGFGSNIMMAGGNYSYNNRYGGSLGPYGSVTFNVSQNVNAGNVSLNAQNVSLNATNITGGSTSLTSAVYGAYLVDSTTIYATGPCRYEVVEYY